MRAVCYLRVSRADQNSAMQLEATSALVRQRGWSLVRTFADEGLSGASDKRPALLELMQQAKRGAFDVVVVYKSDRMFRSTSHLLATVAELDAYGVKFVSCTEPFDTASPAMGKLMLTIFGAIAEFERELLRSRTRDGLEATRRRGTRLGRPARAIDITLVRRLRAEDWSWDRIARRVGVGRATLLRAVAAERASSS
jgi:DNA invertase Pin-like site-specific DNA recombinase